MRTGRNASSSVTLLFVPTGALVAYIVRDPERYVPESSCALLNATLMFQERLYPPLCHTKTQQPDSVPKRDPDD